MIRALFGLGNPGAQYRYTPHNVGFELLEFLSDAWESGRLGEVARDETLGRLVWLVKPQTFMNHSGRCIQPFMQKNGVKPEETLVIYDDADVPVGRVRFVLAGGARGHNGLRSTISNIGVQFWRLGIGVGRDASVDLGTHVLRRMPLQSYELIVSVFERIGDHFALMCSGVMDDAKEFVRQVNGS